MQNNPNTFIVVMEVDPVSYGGQWRNAEPSLSQ